MPLMLTYFPLTVLTLLGDAPGVASVPAGAALDLSALPPWLVPVLSAVGLWLFSSGVDAINAAVKKRDADGIPTGPRARFVLAVLNVMAGNMLKGKRVVGEEAKP